jgi:hypothetical protein
VIRQYNPTVSRSRRVDTHRGVMETGVIPVGTICMVRGRKVMVEAWIPREYATWDARDRKMRTTYMRGGHIAQVRDLRTGQRHRIGDWALLDREVAA